MKFKFSIRRDIDAIRDYVLIKHGIIETEIYKSSVNNVSDFKIENINFNNFNSNVIYFYNKIKNIPNINLSNFNNNIKTLNIDYEYTEIEDGLVGYYDSNKNIIRLLPEDSTLSINHELMHMTSNYRDKDIIYTGFSQIRDYENDWDIIGSGLNEGYTELLSRRYFKKIPNYYVYSNEINIVKAIERIIGRNHMQKLYFNADLYTLTEDLCFYSPKNEVVKFVRNVDLCHYLDDINNSTKIEYDCFNKLMKSINHFLLDTYLNKINIDMQQDPNEITKISKRICEFTKLIGMILITNGVKYRMISIEEYDYKLNKYLSNYDNKNKIINNIEKEMNFEKQKRLSK